MGKKTIMTELTCPKCGEVNLKTERDLKGAYNWKCIHCYKIIPFNVAVGVIWKTDTGGTANRRST